MKCHILGTKQHVQSLVQKMELAKKTMSMLVWFQDGLGKKIVHPWFAHIHAPFVDAQAHAICPIEGCDSGCA